MVKSIYLHIPFCEKKCNYCAFCSYELFRAKDEYVNSLIKEIKFHYEIDKSKPLKTLYFGGGTPFLLDISDFVKILECFNFNSDTELTIEANPSNLSCQENLNNGLKKLKELKKLGFNRLSIGVQNFDNNILKILGRTHNKNRIYTAIENARNAGFNNISIDLMYGLPSQDIKNWSNTLDEALKLNPEHISLYGLKIEKGTYFYKFPPKNLPDNDMQALLYENAIEKLKEKYFHYEFSNFALNNNLSKDYISKHNCAYWTRDNYWGFGLSASGFIKNKRYTNITNLKEYIKNPIKKDFIVLSKQEEIEEEIFLGLRLYHGLNFNHINKKYDINIFQMYQKEFNKFLKEGFLIETNVGVKLTLKGILLSNEILCEFIKI